MVILVVRAAFWPGCVPWGNPANTRGARLSGLPLVRSWMVSTALPNVARYQLRYTRIFSFCYYTTLGAKIKDFPVCGHSCGQSRFLARLCSLGKSRKRPCCKAFRASASQVVDSVGTTPKAGALPTALHPVIKFFRVSACVPKAGALVSCGSRKNLRAYADPRFFRPLPLTQLPLSAAGGGRLVPQLRYTRLCENAPP